MLRVTTVDEQAATVTLKVEGRISCDGSENLQRECQSFLEEGKCVQLEFSEVSFIDRRGVEMLRALQRQPVYVIYASPLISELLKEADLP